MQTRYDVETVLVPSGTGKTTVRQSINRQRRLHKLMRRRLGLSKRQYVNLRKQMQREARGRLI